MSLAYVIFENIANILSLLPFLHLWMVVFFYEIYAQSLTHARLVCNQTSPHLYPLNLSGGQIQQEW